MTTAVLELDCKNCTVLSKKLNASKEWNKFYQQKLENRDKFLHIAVDYDREKQHNVELQLLLDQRSRESSYYREQMTNLLLEFQPIKEKATKLGEELEEERRRREQVENELTGFQFSNDQLKHEVTQLKVKMNSRLVETLEKKLTTARSDIKRLKVHLEDKNCEITDIKAFQADRRLQFERINKRGFWALKLAKGLVEVMPKGLLRKSFSNDILERLDQVLQLTEKMAFTHYSELYKKQLEKLKKENIQMSMICSLEDWLDDFDKLGNDEEDAQVDTVIPSAKTSSERTKRKSSLQDGKKLEKLLEEDGEESLPQNSVSQHPVGSQGMSKEAKSVKKEKLVLSAKSPLPYKTQSRLEPLKEESTNMNERFQAYEVGKKKGAKVSPVKESKKQKSVFDSDGEDDESVENQMKTLLKRKSCPSSTVSSPRQKRKRRSTSLGNINQPFGEESTQYPASSSLDLKIEDVEKNRQREISLLKIEDVEKNRPREISPANDAADDDLISAILNDMKPHLEVDALESSFSLSEPDFPNSLQCVDGDQSVFTDVGDKISAPRERSLVDMSNRNTDELMKSKPKILLSQSSEGFPTADLLAEDAGSLLSDLGISMPKNVNCDIASETEGRMDVPKIFAKEFNSSQSFSLDADELESLSESLKKVENVQENSPICKEMFKSAVVNNDPKEDDFIDTSRGFKKKAPKLSDLKEEKTGGISVKSNNVNSSLKQRSTGTAKVKEKIDNIQSSSQGNTGKFKSNSVEQISSDVEVDDIFGLISDSEDEEISVKEKAQTKCTSEMSLDKSVLDRSLEKNVDDIQKNKVQFEVDASKNDEMKNQTDDTSIVDNEKKKYYKSSDVLNFLEKEEHCEEGKSSIEKGRNVAEAVLSKVEGEDVKEVLKSNAGKVRDSISSKEGDSLKFLEMDVVGENLQERELTHVAMNSCAVVNASLDKESVHNTKDEESAEGRRERQFIWKNKSKLKALKNNEGKVESESIASRIARIKEDYCKVLGSHKSESYPGTRSLRDNQLTRVLEREVKCQVKDVNGVSEVGTQIERETMVQCGEENILQLEKEIFIQPEQKTAVSENSPEFHKDNDINYSAPKCNNILGGTIADGDNLIKQNTALVESAPESKKDDGDHSSAKSKNTLADTFADGDNLIKQNTALVESAPEFKKDDVDHSAAKSKNTFADGDNLIKQNTALVESAPEFKKDDVDHSAAKSKNTFADGDNLIKENTALVESAPEFKKDDVDHSAAKSKNTFADGDNLIKENTALVESAPEFKKDDVDHSAAKSKNTFADGDNLIKQNTALVESAPEFKKDDDHSAAKSKNTFADGDNLIKQNTALVESALESKKDDGHHSAAKSKNTLADTIADGDNLVEYIEDIFGIISDSDEERIDNDEKVPIIIHESSRETINIKVDEYNKHEECQESDTAKGGVDKCDAGKTENLQRIPCSADESSQDVIEKGSNDTITRGDGRDRKETSSTFSLPAVLSCEGNLLSPNNNSPTFSHPALLSPEGRTVTPNKKIISGIMTRSRERVRKISEVSSSSDHFSDSADNSIQGSDRTRTRSSSRIAAKHEVKAIGRRKTRSWCGSPEKFPKTLPVSGNKRRSASKSLSVADDTKDGSCEENCEVSGIATSSHRQKSKRIVTLEQKRKAFQQEMEQRFAKNGRQPCKEDALGRSGDLQDSEEMELSLGANDPMEKILDGKNVSSDSLNKIDGAENNPSCDKDCKFNENIANHSGFEEGNSTGSDKGYDEQKRVPEKNTDFEMTNEISKVERMHNIKNISSDSLNKINGAKNNPSSDKDCKSSFNENIANHSGAEVGNSIGFDKGNDEQKRVPGKNTDFEMTDEISQFSYRGSNPKETNSDTGNSMKGSIILPSNPKEANNDACNSMKSSIIFLSSAAKPQKNVSAVSSRILFNWIRKPQPTPEKKVKFVRQRNICRLAADGYRSPPAVVFSLENRKWNKVGHCSKEESTKLGEINDKDVLETTCKSDQTYSSVANKDVFGTTCKSDQTYSSVATSLQRANLPNTRSAMVVDDTKDTKKDSLSVDDTKDTKKDYSSVDDTKDTKKDYSSVYDTKDTKKGSLSVDEAADTIKDNLIVEEAMDTEMDSLNQHRGCSSKSTTLTRGKRKKYAGDGEKIIKENVEDASLSKKSNWKQKRRQQREAQRNLFGTDGSDTEDKEESEVVATQILECLKKRPSVKMTAISLASVGKKTANNYDTSLSSSKDSEEEEEDVREKREIKISEQQVSKGSSSQAEVEKGKVSDKVADTLVQDSDSDSLNDTVKRKSHRKMGGMLLTSDSEEDGKVTTRSSIHKPSPMRVVDHDIVSGEKFNTLLSKKGPCRSKLEEEISRRRVSNECKQQVTKGSSSEVEKGKLSARVNDTLAQDSDSDSLKDTVNKKSDRKSCGMISSSDSEDEGKVTTRSSINKRFRGPDLVKGKKFDKLQAKKGLDISKFEEEINRRRVSNYNENPVTKRSTSQVEAVKRKLSVKVDDTLAQDSDSGSMTVTLKNLNRKSDRNSSGMLLTTDSEDDGKVTTRSSIHIPSPMKVGEIDVVKGKDSATLKAKKGSYKSKLTRKAATMHKKSFYPVTSQPQYSHVNNSRDCSDDKDSLKSPVKIVGTVSSIKQKLDHGSPKLASSASARKDIVKHSPPCNYSEVMKKLSMNVRNQQEGKRATILLSNTPNVPLKRRKRESLVNSDAERDQPQESVNSTPEVKEPDPEMGEQISVKPWNEDDPCDIDHTSDSDEAALSIFTDVDAAPASSQNKKSIPVSTLCTVNTLAKQEQSSPNHAVHPGLVGSLGKLGSLARPKLQPKAPKQSETASAIVPASSDFVTKLFLRSSSYKEAEQSATEKACKDEEGDISQQVSTNQGFQNGCADRLASESKASTILPTKNVDSNSKISDNSLLNFYGSSKAVVERDLPEAADDQLSLQATVVCKSELSCNNELPKVKEVVSTPSLEKSSSSISISAYSMERWPKLLDKGIPEDQCMKMDSTFEEILGTRVCSQQWHHLMNRICCMNSSQGPDIKLVARILIKKILQADTSEQRERSTGLTPSMFKLFQVMCVYEKRNGFPHSQMKKFVLMNIHKLILTSPSLRAGSLGSLTSWFTATAMLRNEKGEYMLEELRSFLLDLLYHHAGNVHLALLSGIRVSWYTMVRHNRNRKSTCLEKLIQWVALYGQWEGRSHVRSALVEWFYKYGSCKDVLQSDPLVFVQQLLEELTECPDEEQAISIIVSIIVFARWQKPSWLQDELLPKVKAHSATNSGQQIKAQNNFKRLIDYLMLELKKPRPPKCELQMKRERQDLCNEIATNGED